MAKTPPSTLHDDAERFYTVLRTLRDESQGDAEQLLPVADAQVEKHRALVVELTSLLERAQEDLDRWAVTAGELRATVHPELEPTGAALRGKALAEIAVHVLKESGKPQPIHYRDWMTLVRLAGYKVAGADPQASFLTQLHRDERIVLIGGRTGLWKLANPQEES